MWNMCHPKTDEDLKECSELGKSLSRLSQPTILTLLAQSGEPMHGYVLVQQAANTLTEKGLLCLRRWIDALACYELTIEELRGQAACALGIDLPPTPECAHK